MTSEKRKRGNLGKREKGEKGKREYGKNIEIVKDWVIVLHLRGPVRSCF